MTNATPAPTHEYEHLNIAANLDVYSFMLRNPLNSVSLCLLAILSLISDALMNMSWPRTWTEGVPPMQLMGEYASAVANDCRMPFSYGLIPTHRHLIGDEDAISLSH